MKLNKNLINLIVIFIFISASLYGCRKGSQFEGFRQEASGKPPLKIGIIMPFSGPRKSAADRQLAAISAAVRTAPELAGRNITIIMEDSENNSGTMADLVNKLAGKGASGVIFLADGDDASRLYRSYSPASGKKKRPCFRPPIPVIVAGSPNETSKTCGGIFRLLPSCQDRIGASLHFIRSTMKADRIAVVFDPGEECGTKTATMFLGEFIKSGGTVLDIVDANEPAGRILHLKNKNPSFILITGADKKTVETAKLLRSNKVETPILFMQPPQDAEISGGLSGIAEVYLLSGFSFQPTKDERCKHLLDALSEEKITPDANTAASIDALLLLIDADLPAGNGRSGMTGTSGNSYLTGGIGLMEDGSVKKSLYVIKLKGSDVELAEEINLVLKD